MKTLDDFLETYFEPVLWKTRYFILISVLCSIVAAITLTFFVGLMDVSHFFSSLWEYLQLSMQAGQGASTVAAHTDARNELTFSLVEMIDTFLMAGVLFIFGFGLYELFVSKISPAKGSSTNGKILNISNIDELKNKLAKVILMILIIKCFYYTVKLPAESFSSVQDVAWLAGIIALIGLGLYLSHSSKHHDDESSNI